MENQLLLIYYGFLSVITIVLIFQSLVLVNLNLREHHYMENLSTSVKKNLQNVLRKRAYLRISLAMAFLACSINLAMLLK